MLMLYEHEKHPNRQNEVSVEHLVIHIARIRAYMIRLPESHPEYRGGFDLASMSDVDVLEEYTRIKF